MSFTTKKSIYESAFEPSDKTDAILVVDEKKLHFNKALLSHYSDYFNTLFNSDFAEKSMPEIPIKDVKFEDFAALLALFQKNPIGPTEDNAENLLKLADLFLLPAAKSQLECFLISTEFLLTKKLRIADKYDLAILLERTINEYDDRSEILEHLKSFSSFSEKTKAKILDRITVLPEREATTESIQYQQLKQPRVRGRW